MTMYEEAWALRRAGELRRRYEETRDNPPNLRDFYPDYDAYRRATDAHQRYLDALMADREAHRRATRHITTEV